MFMSGESDTPHHQATPRARFSGEPRLNGATKTLLAAHGFGVSSVAGLVNHGLAIMTPERVRAGGKMIAVARGCRAGRVVGLTLAQCRCRGRRRALSLCIRQQSCPYPFSGAQDDPVEGHVARMKDRSCGP